MKKEILWVSFLALLSVQGVKAEPQKESGKCETTSEVKQQCCPKCKEKNCKCDSLCKARHKCCHHCCKDSICNDSCHWRCQHDSLRKGKCPCCKKFKMKNFENFKQERDSFIMKEAGLSKEEMEKVTVIFNSMKTAQMENEKKSFEKVKAMSDPKKKFTEKEYHKALDEINALALEKAKMEKLFYSEMEKKLSAEKVFKVRSAEAKFRLQKAKMMCHHHHHHHCNAPQK